MTILIIIVAVVGAFLLFAASRPNTYRVERSLGIKAPPDKIFPLISDFRQWTGWSPWEKMDPAMRRTHTGAASGTGAKYEWEGNKKVGMGRMEITSTMPGSRVVIQLDFLKPFEAHNVTTFNLAASGGTTNVTWLMDGSHNYMSKVMSVFMNMDKMIGKDFEAGLANLKTLAER
jgi:uncharacterized protein YndB with AHSA1/START domain